jgi:NADH-quinone oxidoreductase subunit L
MTNLLWLIPVLPLAGFLVNGLARPPKAIAALVGCAGPVASFILSVLAFQAAQGGPVSEQLFEWITVSGDKLAVPFGLRVDELSAVMILIVTGVGSLIHIYSIAYMHDDPGFSRFFAYLNLFMFSMLVLVMGDSIVLMFLGWEGVGLCSYLLIGFWYKELKNADAGKKAFITNRIGDFGFILGIFCLWALYKDLNFAGMAGMALPETVRLAGHEIPSDTLVSWAGLFLFLGACGKSAQIPLYVWLPDAMAGPTPVSALIHAATMVTAGVYMMGRMNFLYVLAPGVLHLVALVAGLTALLAGVIAVAQNDIKKVLAYSTVSQLGFMFAGIACLDFTAGLFHVVTHAFFKALLFLGAGAVIHALHGEQDIRKMGGLGKKLPGLAAVFAAGALALAGCPFFSGFVSKDQILTAAFVHEPLVYGILAFTALLTAFYTTRLCVMVFLPRPGGPGAHHGDEAAQGGPDAGHHELHKPGLLMMGPLVVLAILSIVGGVALDRPLHQWLGRVWGSEKSIEENIRLLSSGQGGERLRAQRELSRIGEEAEARLPAKGDTETLVRVRQIKEEIARHHHAHELNMLLSSVLFVLGAGSALVIYTRARPWLARLVEGPLRKIHVLVENKFYVDELYEYLVIAPVQMGATLTWFLVDRVLIDTILVNGAGRLVYALGGLARRPHTGSINMAGISFVVGVLAILSYIAFEIWKAFPS